MRRGSKHNDINFESSESSADESNVSSESSTKNFKLSKTPVIKRTNGHPNRFKRNVTVFNPRSNYTASKLRDVFSNFSYHEPSRIPVYSYPKKYEVTLDESKYSDNEKTSSKFDLKLCQLQRETNYNYNKSQENSSTNDIVALHYKKSNVFSSPPSTTLAHTTNSEHNIVNTSPPPQDIKNVEESYFDKTIRRPIETPENSSSKFRRKKHVTSKKRRSSKQREPLNVNIFHESQVIQVVQPVDSEIDRKVKPKDSRGILSRPVEDLIRQYEDSSKQADKKGDWPKGKVKHCYPDLHLRTKYHHSKHLEKSDCKMAHFSNDTKNDNPNPQDNQNFIPNYEFLMQHMKMNPKDINSDKNPNYEDDGKRNFPFKTTLSGNLKIIPNQVVYESKKVSVLVADPKHTKVNVQAQLSRPDIDSNPTDHHPRTKQSHIDLPPGVTPSTINHLQARKKLPPVEGEYRPRTQPYISNNCPLQKDQSTSSLSQVYQIDDVPLSSLGFNNDQPIDWESIVLPEKTDLYQELARRITNYKNADCIVRLGPDEFHCHLLVLQSYSTFFDDKNVKDIDITKSNVTSKAFSIIYDWMITSAGESCQLLRRDNILEVFMAAQFLGVKELEEQCWAFIDNDELFSEDTAFLLYLEARKVENAAVMELMVPRIMKFFLLLVGTKDFFDLSVEELCLLLKSNYICVNSEMEVLMSAVRWLMYDWEDRKKYMIQVLKCVRFGLIAPWQLVDIKRNPENPEFLELMSYPEVQKMVDDGLGYVIIKYWYATQTEDYHHWIEQLGLTEPNNRHWAGEDKNYVTYREFLSYLEEYREKTVAELKERKSKVKPAVINLPPKDQSPTSAVPQTNYPSNYMNTDTGSYDQGDTIANNRRAPKNTVNGIVHQSFNPPADISSPEMLRQYLTNFDRNKGVSRGASDGKSATFDKRMSAGGEPSNKVRVANQVNRNLPKMGHRGEHSKINPMIAQETSRNQQQQSAIMKKKPQKTVQKRQSACSTVTPKSDDEAATVIQAFYRGYKVRRQCYEIKRTSSEEKRNTKKVAELLAIPDTANADDCKKCVGMKANDSAANDALQESRNECSKNNADAMINDCLVNSINYKTKDKIETIKYPAFDNNDVSISASPSENTDNSDQQLPNVEEKSTVELQTHETLYQNSMYKNIIRSGKNRTNTNKSRNFAMHCQLSKKKIQRLETIFQANEYAYFIEASLYFPDTEAILVFGGIDPYANYGGTGNTGKDIYRYVPSNNTWEFVGEIPEPRHHHSAAFLKGRVYLAGGVDPRNTENQRKSNAVATVWSLDPTTRIWYEEPKMCVPRRNFGLIVSDGKLYAFGGQDHNGVILKTAETYDPIECNWKEIHSMSMPRMGHAVVKYGNLIWIVGGIKNSKKGSLLKEVECYDPVKNLWLKNTSLPEARAYASMYVISDDMYIIGGAGKIRNETQSMSSIDIWDSNARTWKYETEMSIARYGHSTASIGNSLFIIGGVMTTQMETLNVVECYSCERKKWMKNICSLPYSISSHSAVSLPPAKSFIPS